MGLGYVRKTGWYDRELDGCDREVDGVTEKWMV